MSGISQITRDCLAAAAKIAVDDQFSSHKIPDELKRGISGIVKAGYVIHVDRTAKTYHITTHGWRYIKLQGLLL